MRVRDRAGVGERGVCAGACSSVKLCRCSEARSPRIGCWDNAIEVLIFLLKRHKQMQTSVNTLEMNSVSLASQRCSMADRKMSN